MVELLRDRINSTHLNVRKNNIPIERLRPGNESIAGNLQRKVNWQTGNA